MGHQIPNFADGPIPKQGRHNRPGDDKAYTRALKHLPCSACGLGGPSDAHHLKCAGQRGMALRSPDRFAVPLCRFHHHELEFRIGSKREREWFAGHGIDCLALANELWAAWQRNRDVDDLQKALMNHLRTR